MGQGPYGPGPLGPGPFLVGRTPHQKAHPGKKSPNCVFWLFFWKQKRCGTSVRSFSTKFRAEISAMCQKTKVSVFEKRPNFVRNLVRNLPSEFKGILHQEVGVASAPQDLPSTRAGGQDDGS